jgi:hypothetical protein
MRAVGQELPAEVAPREPEPSSCAIDLSPPASNVSRLIAGILVTLAMEPVHA